jgi:hypothetical protein
MASKFLVLRCENDEHAQYFKDASANGETLSSWTRRCLRLGRAQLLLAQPSKDAHKKRKQAVK